MPNRDMIERLGTEAFPHIHVRPAFVRRRMGAEAAAMKTFLKVWYVLVLLAMLAVTTWAQSHEGLLSALARIPNDPWFVATLFDTYFAFLAFFFWVCARERSLAAKIVWLVLILLLGNIAMAVYVLIQLARLKSDEPASAILKPAT